MSKKETAGKKLPSLNKLPLKMRAGLLAAAAVLLIITSFVYILNSNKAYAVVVDGETIATVASKQDADAVIEQLIDQQDEKYGKPVTVVQDITIEKVSKDEKKLVSADQLKQRLIAVLDYKIQGAAVKVNGKVQFAFKSRQEAENFITALKEEYKTAQDAEIKFEEEVEVAEMALETGKITSVKSALKKVKEEGSVPRYKVKEGDTLWDIAVNNGISVDELLAANPGFKPELMQIGQVIKLSDKEPLINVVSIHEEIVEEKIEAPVTIKRNSSMLQGKTKVVEPGEDGLKEVKYRFIAKNGEQTEKIILDEKVIKEPKARIVEKGTRMLVASRNYGGGRLAKPAAGGISSAFGPRWGRMHEGVDMAAAYGSPVVAADSGKVVRAGWYGNYGKCVDISHGNGIVTRYAHLSNIKVKVGQQVKRNQVIGNVGTTGRTTGPHLHFEVRVNGRAVNPVNYM